MPHSILVYENGGPEVMKWEEIKINSPDKGEVLIEQKNVGLNYICPTYPSCLDEDTLGSQDISSCNEDFILGDINEDNSITIQNDGNGITIKKHEKETCENV